MKCGLLGEKLGHSYSPAIHGMLADYEYKLYEKSPDEVGDFLLHGDWDGLNVTIPYKKTVLPYCDELSGRARRIGSVNTLVRRADGTIFGENTDACGFEKLIARAGIGVQGQKALVLGSGGASVMAVEVLRSLGAASVTVISRHGEDNYENLSRHADAQLIVNTTPVGMYPKNGEAAVDLLDFPRCEGVLDVVYNPARTALLLQAERLGVKHAGGLYMLVAQAVLAAEKFIDQDLDVIGLTNQIYDEIYFDKRNIVLSGMPASGKSTVGKLVADQLDRELIDTDRLIVEREGHIPTIFREKGETYFRDLETAVIKEVSAYSGKVISLGGGAVMRPENVEALRHNGAIFFIDRSPENLIPTDDRPLADKKEKILRLYKKRIDTYMSTADFIIDGDCDPEDVADSVINGE